jgi:hypothetical protein
MPGASKRFAGRRRVPYVKTSTAIGWVLADRVGTVLTHTLSWSTACCAIGVMTLAGLFRLLSEWQRRLTLVAIIERARAGTVVVQERGPGGPAMWVQVGYGPPQAGPGQGRALKSGPA